MVANCRVCGCGLDEQDLQNAGMDVICWNCWEDEHKSKIKVHTSRFGGGSHVKIEDLQELLTRDKRFTKELMKKIKEEK